MIFDDDINRYAKNHTEFGFILLPVWRPDGGGCTCPDAAICPHPGKHPKRSGWNKPDWTSWTDFSQCNIGIRCGSRNGGPPLMIIDIDERNGGLETWATIGDDFPMTRTALTGNGHHLYYYCEGIATGSNALGPGVDIKAGIGSYVVGPGSLHASGKMYHWLDPDRPIIELEKGEPAWCLLPQVGTKRRGTRRNTSYTPTGDGAIPKGQRNNTLYNLACSEGRTILNKGGSKEDIYDAIYAINLARCKPPVADVELQTLVESAWAFLSDPANDRPMPEPSPEAMRWAHNTSQPPPAASDADAFWSATAARRGIYEAARTRELNEWALLGTVLAKVVCEIPWFRYLAGPPAKASLNLLVALCGPVGMGKTAAMGAADELLPEETVHWEPIGSGEGIAQLYGVQPTGTERKKHPDVKFKRTRWQAGAIVDEIGELAAKAGRTGSSLVAVLKTAAHGGILGAANASADRYRHVKAHTYRFCLVAGVQPIHAGVILDDVDGGFPQRWLWLPTDAKQCDDGILLDEWRWHAPPWILAYHDHTIGGNQPKALKVLRDVKQACKDQRWEAKNSGSPWEGHAALTRLKVAAALAALESQEEVTWQFWEDAGIVMEISTNTLEWLIAEHERLKNEEFEKRAIKKKEHADKAQAVADAKNIEQGVKRLADSLQRRGPLGRRDVNRFLYRYGDLKNDIIEAALQSGRVKLIPPGGNESKERYAYNPPKS